MTTDSMSSITSRAIASGGAGEVNKGESSAQRAPARIERQNIAGSGQDNTAVEQARVSRDKIDRVVSELKDFVQSMQRDLSFHVDDVTGEVVIQVVDMSTNKVVRQIPEEEVLNLARRLEGMLDEMPKGILIENEA